jgi:acyl-CoA synthetase (NDP forming)
MILDTHEAVEKMVEAGASKKMAEAIVKTLNSSSDNLATKQDIREVRSEIKEIRSEIQVLEVSLRSEIAEVKTELKADIAEVRSELKVLATQFATMKWMQYTILGLLFAPMVAQFLAMYFK